MFVQLMTQFLDPCQSHQFLFFSHRAVKIKGARIDYLNWKMVKRSLRLAVVFRNLVMLERTIVKMRKGSTWGLRFPCVIKIILWSTTCFSFNCRHTDISLFWQIHSKRRWRMTVISRALPHNNKKKMKKRWGKKRKGEKNKSFDDWPANLLTKC